MSIELKQLADWHASQACQVRKAAECGTAAENKEPVHGCLLRLADWHDRQSHILRTAIQQAESAEAQTKTGVPDDVARDADRYRWLRRKACVIGKTTYCGEETGQPILDFVNLPDVTEVICRDSASTLDAAIDAAMIAAKEK